MLIEFVSYVIAYVWQLITCDHHDESLGYVVSGCWSSSQNLSINIIDVIRLSAPWLSWYMCLQHSGNSTIVMFDLNHATHACQICLAIADEFRFCTCPLFNHIYTTISHSCYRAHCQATALLYTSLRWIAHIVIHSIFVRITAFWVRWTIHINRQHSQIHQYVFYETTTQSLNILVTCTGSSASLFAFLFLIVVRNYSSKSYPDITAFLTCWTGVSCWSANITNHFSSMLSSKHSARSHMHLLLTICTQRVSQIFNIHLDSYCINNLAHLVI